MKKILLPMAALCGLSACCSIDPYASYAGRVSPAAVAAVSKDMAEYVVTVLPPGKSTVWIRPAGHTKEITGAALENALRERGFAVAPDGPTRPVGTHELRYLIEPYGEGATARIILDGRLVSRWYGTDATGNVLPAGPFAVFEGEAP